MNSPVMPDPSPLPSATVATGATGLATVLGWGAAVLATKWKVPVDVLGAGLGLVFTGLTTLWHRFIPGK